MRLRFATLLALLVLVRPAAAAPSLPVYAGEWRRLSDPVDPPPMQADPVVRDSRRHRLLLLSGSPRAYMTELWSLPIDALAEPRWVREVTASEGPPPLFHWRYSAVYDSLHDRVIVFGGYVHREANEFSNELWALSLADTPPRWGQLAPSGPAPIPRADASLVVDAANDRLLLFGGDAGSSPTETWSYDLATNAWSHVAVAGRVPGGRSAAAAVFDPQHDRMVVFGGSGPGGTLYGPQLDDTWALSFAGTPHWDSLVTNIRPQARHGMAACLDPLSGSLVIANGAGPAAFADTWELTLDAGAPQWRFVDTIGDPPVVGDVAAIFSPELNRVLEYGGDRNPYQNRLSELAMGNRRWVAVPPPAPDPIPRPRIGARLIADGNGIQVFGGYAYACESTLWAFDERSQAWVSLPTVGLPQQCYDQPFVFDPLRNRLLAIGNADVNAIGSLEDVWEMPLTGARAWHRLDPAGPHPTWRRRYSLVYDTRRDRVLLFGGTKDYTRGADCGLSRDDVWALDLAGGPKWELLAPENSPGTHESHAAWYDPVNDRMIIFGGRRELLPESLGCVYDLLNDVWALSFGGDSPRWTRFALGSDPPARGVSTYDPARQEVLVWDGDLWGLPLQPGATWEPRYEQGELPSPRSAANLVFDVARDRVLLFGGALDPRDASAGPLTNDLFAFERSGPDGTQITLRDSVVSDAAVTLRFQGLAPFQNVLVQRSDGGAFVTLHAAGADAVGRLDMTDTDIVPAHSYSYALADAAGTRRFVTVGVESATTPVFALGGAYPNPATGPLSMLVSLAGPGPAQVVAFDIAGRRVVERVIAGVGRHTVGFGVLPPGLYLVRLSQGSLRAYARAAVIR